ncbi:phosphatase PAP2 family protein [Paenibacillus sp. P22]|uniref:phosphatase PAP2 family protein n=1 Tax=Paenibacillus sp. P22 TaxID=483908 RepID=UPI00038F8795|nr:hypothetical protein BN871_AM_00040 [Paenibacillus sp. P22]
MHGRNYRMAPDQGAAAAVVAQPRTCRCQAACGYRPLAVDRHPYGRSHVHAGLLRPARSAGLGLLEARRRSEPDRRHREPSARRARQAHDEEAAALPGARGGPYRQEPLEDSSFPSGHTTAIFAWTVPLLYAAASGAAFPLALFAGLAIACSVGWSRMYLGLHYPSDVGAGALLGTFTAMLAVVFIGSSI